MENFQTAEQHVECRPSRIRRDVEDLIKIKALFIQCDPFQERVCNSYCFRRRWK